MTERQSDQVGKHAVVHTSREPWLGDVTKALAAWFDDLGFPVSRFSVTSGFPSSGRRSRRIAESWPQEDGSGYRIFVRPDATDMLSVAAALAQELAWISATGKGKGRHLYRHLAVSIGLRGGRRESAPGLLFRELIDPILKQVGPMPAALDSGPLTAQPKQPTRLIKAACPQCGYVVRVARKWLDEVGPPHCPKHGAMRHEGRKT